MRLKLCTLKAQNDCEKTAYVPEVKAFIGAIFNVKGTEWEVIDVSLNSILSGSLKNFKTVVKEEYTQNEL